MEIKEDDVLMCTVKNIQGTTIFVEVEGGEQGSIVMSEIAAGRIRNLREYVAPNKKIVCKVLRVIDGHPQLSLRRVTAKERDSVLDRHKKEKQLLSMLKTIVENPKEIIEKIKEKYDAPDFLEEAREDPKILESYLSKDQAERLSKILLEKKEKDKIVKKIIILKSTASSGLEDIKSILKVEGVKINYLGSSKFSISTSAKDFKEANAKIAEVLELIEKRAKEKSAEFKVKEK